MRSIGSLFLAFIFVFCAFSSRAQKVALVLSGGGAKGLAHVGVLKALEENNIPIDYVVGTSMGGIVAACYASGYSAKEIEDMMLSKDLQRWVSGELEKGYNYYYSMEEPNAAFLSLQLSLDSTLNASFTSSLASDLSLNFALLERFAQPSANANYNFDSLFVPTRLMAADIFTQNEIAIDSGSLGSAVRATLSVPFFYKPIKFNGKYLFDGGIYNNFPVDVAQREFDPDVVIGVNVSSKVFNNYPEKEDEALINRSLLFMLLDKSNPEIIPSSGIYIEPNLKGYNAFDFAKVRMLIDSGYVTTLKSMDEIKSKIGREINRDTLAHDREGFISKHTPLVFTDINFHGFNSKQQKFIKHIFKYKKGSLLYLDDIKKGYFRLVSEQYFRTIYPDLRFDENSNGYHLEIHGRPENNLSVEIGGSIATRNISQVFLGIEHYYFNNYLLKNSVSFYTGSFYKSAQIKSKLNLPALGQFYIETDFTYNNWDYISEEDVLAIKKDPTIVTRTDRRYGLNIGFPIGSQFKAVANSALINNNDQFSNFNSFNSRDTLDQLDVNGIKAGLTFSRNNLNRKQYPSLGSSFRLDLDYFNLEEAYIPGSTSMSDVEVVNTHQWLRAKLTLEQYFKKGWYSSGYYIQGNISNQPFFSNYTSTLLYSPGFIAMQDSESLFLQNFKGHNYLTVGLRNVMSIRKNLDFRLEGYAFKAFDAIKKSENQTPSYDQTDFENIFLAGTAGLVLHSPIGPISLSLNYYDDQETQWGVLMHVGYLLFQPRSVE